MKNIIKEYSIRNENYFNRNNISVIQMDSYYKDLKHLPMNKREQKNFDHPDAFDFELLINHLKILFQKKSVEIPIYDYKTHTRRTKTHLLQITPIVIIEGIFSLHYQKLKDLMNLKIFIESSNETRKKRFISPSPTIAAIGQSA